MGEPTPSLKEIDIALRHNETDRALSYLRQSKLHPFSKDYRLREALVELNRGNANIGDILKGIQLEPEERARLLRNLARMHVRKCETKKATHVLEQLERYKVTDPGWLYSIYGLVAYLEAHQGLRKKRVTGYKKASELFAQAEEHWNEHGCANKYWRINNTWRYWRSEYRIARLTHLIGRENLTFLDRLRWDVIDNDQSNMRGLIARWPCPLFDFFADKM